MRDARFFKIEKTLLDSEIPHRVPRIINHKRLSMTYKIPGNTHIGHVHLKVSDLERSLKFYRDLLGFELQQMETSNT